MELPGRHRDRPDFTPATADVIAEMIAEHFDPDLATVAVGGLELAQAFSATRWDHLIFTGSPSVGRQVMLAAAANLVPVTLELGGKCPVVIDEGAVTEENVRINAVAIQGALPSLGFGGIGNSGMGRHHGLDGFRELSNPRGISRRGSGDLLDAFGPPYGDIAAAVSGAMFGEA